MAKCFSPIQIKNPQFNGQDKMLNVRCGKCENCIRTLINDWSFRLEQEAKDHIYVDFITLTYDPKYVPLTKNELPTLDKTDVQKFWKRLRKRSNAKIKYFVVGEYGTKSYRPHYHAIVFGLSEQKHYEKAWQKGYVHIGDYFSPAAIRYTLKYMYKKGQVPLFPEDDREPEFRSMSQKLGARFISKQRYEYYFDDITRINFVQTAIGKQTMPRYYRKKLLRSIDEDKLKKILPEVETVESNPHKIRQLYKKFEKDKLQDQRNKI